jgi:hypothetical protein
MAITRGSLPSYAASQLLVVALRGYEALGDFYALSRSSISFF